MFIVCSTQTCHLPKITRIKSLLNSVVDLLVKFGVKNCSQKDFTQGSLQLKANEFTVLSYPRVECTVNRLSMDIIFRLNHIWVKFFC